MSSQSRKLTLAVSLACAVAFAAAGCGSDESSSDADSNQIAALQKQIGSLEQQVKDLKIENITLKARLAKRSDGGGSVAPSADSGAGKSYDAFQLASGNISCQMDKPAYARCDIMKKTFTPPAQPSDCPLDWGSALGVQGARKGQFICHGDTVVVPDAPVLQYGESSTVGAVTCDSSAAGIECRNNDTGHGFFLAKEKYRTY